jgi:transposase InsO family protein
VRSPQTNGICERFHKTVKDEFYSIAFRRKIYLSLDELQKTSMFGSTSTTTRGLIRGNGARKNAHGYLQRQPPSGKRKMDQLYG